MTANALRFLSEHIAMRGLSDITPIRFEFGPNMPRVVVPDRDFSALARWAVSLSYVRVEHAVGGFHAHGRLGSGMEIHVVSFTSYNTGPGDELPYGEMKLGLLEWLARNQIEGAAA
ncbi:hypothetical protein ABZ215_33445 [Amycolatopsis sp. NPDC006131]|uniref:hypothetical protein n=1 Tax=Amycolatopsis sp. NPDC006131 TaxID=3156731 RepID=UPI0033BB0566